MDGCVHASLLSNCGYVISCSIWHVLILKLQRDDWLANLLNIDGVSGVARRVHMQTFPAEQYSSEQGAALVQNGLAVQLSV
jgi:hypothetical protein